MARKKRTDIEKFMRKETDVDGRKKDAFKDKVEKDKRKTSKWMETHRA